MNEKVIELSEKFDVDFVYKCKDELKDILILSEEINSNKEE